MIADNAIIDGLFVLSIKLRSNSPICSASHPDRANGKQGHAQADVLPKSDIIPRTREEIDIELEVRAGCVADCFHHDRGSSNGGAKKCQSEQTVGQDAAPGSRSCVFQQHALSRHADWSDSVHRS